MMIKTSPERGSLASTNSHPRRPPAHLSVCLRHESPPYNTKPGGSTWPAEPQESTIAKRTITANESSDENDGGSSGRNVQKWFDRSNKNPKVTFSRGLERKEPPYFLPHNSSNNSNELWESGHHRYVEGQRTNLDMLRSATNGSNVDDFRSVIDDLTIENKKLKKKLRKLQTPYTPDLDKDRLFEVKVHGLSGRNRRLLEDTLRAFASTLDHCAEGESPKAESGKRNYITINPAQKLSSSSSTSNSRPVDSAYASMSNYGPTSTANLNRTSMAGKLSNQTKQGNEKNIQSFLYNIPEGLRPKRSPVMTERQKKKLVVQRLERLFTGKMGVVSRTHSQPLQQQEVSRSAARADQPSADKNSLMEGVREANMLPILMEVDSRPGGLLDQSSSDTQTSRELSDSSEDQSPNENEHEQRPTRPLDLDPDRAQIPSENVEYIRHLGQSTPHLATEDSPSAASGAQGWMYLNLLVNMAQLHIINVTPDFIRHAVQEVSENFQLSRDGNKIRWRGGSRGTALSSSDSGTSSALDRSPQDSDSLDDGGGKRRKVNSGRFAFIPVDIQASQKSLGVSGQSKSLHYKPLFNHRGSCPRHTQSSDESDSRIGCGAGHDSGIGRASRVQRTWSGRSRSGSQGRRRRDDGPMVFYSGAKFCTDLSGDREISPPLHITGVGADGFSDHTQDALGCGLRENAPLFLRTTSGSTLPFRPFKEQQSLQVGNERPTTPDILIPNPSENEMFINEPLDNSGRSNLLQAFDASGLGGTQPADHFAVQVETRRTKFYVHEPAKLSRFSAPGVRLRKFYHTIPIASLKSFVQPESQSNEETITTHLASLAAFSSSPATQPTISVEELPVKTEFLSAKFIRLEPSQLPEPSGYYDTSSSGDESEYNATSSASISHLTGRSFLGRSYMTTSDPETSDRKVEKTQYSTNVEDNSGDDDDDSIDMLAHERILDPESVRQKEKEFEMALNARVSEPPRSSVATIAETELCSIPSSQC